MNSDDLNLIESKLNISLPEEYKAFMLAIDNDLLVGNADCDLWDNAKALIERNIQLRSGENMGGTKNWPSHLYFIGDPLTNCGNAIDLNDEKSSVFWFDHCDLNSKSSGIVSASFSEWAEEVDENTY